MDEKTDWISAILWKLAAASRRTGLTKSAYFDKYRDEIVRHNRFP